MDRKNTLNPVESCTCKTSSARSKETCHEQKFTSRRSLPSHRSYYTKKIISNHVWDNREESIIHLWVIDVQQRCSPAHGIIWFNFNKSVRVSEKFAKVKMSSWQETWQQVTDFRLNLINFHSPLYFVVYRDGFYRDGFQAFRFRAYVIPLIIPRSSFRRFRLIITPTEYNYLQHGYINVARILFSRCFSFTLRDYVAALII